MNLRDLTLERDLHFVIRGSSCEGRVFVGDVREVRPGKWACGWSISYINPEVAKVYGDDAMDAVFQCLRFVGDLIRGSEEDGLEVWWRAPGDHAGF